MSLKENISRYLYAGYPILYVNAFDEAKVEAIIKATAAGKTIATWSLANGYGEVAPDPANNIPFHKDNTTEITALLDFKLEFSEDLGNSIFVIKDAHTILGNEHVVAALKELAVKICGGLECCIVLISPVVKIPVELEKYITILENDYQSFDDICNIIRDFVSDKPFISLDQVLLSDMAVAFKGLSEFEIQKLLDLAFTANGDLTRSDLKLIFEQKKQMVMKSGILEMIPLKEKIDDIGGLENLKEWLKRKAKVVTNIKNAEAFGVDMPKGVLIAGVPGCGKSLCAKAAASLFEVPILRLDIGKLMGKYLGESEANLRKAINLAEAISPCVLWVDELEKAFAGMGSDGGHEVTTRLFGTFLTWMQEKTSPTFVVATANDITKLPPELLRKGRFDEIFFVGLPKHGEREKIFRIHVGKRRSQDAGAIRFDELASKTDGYSGADIEGVVAEAVEYAFAEGKTMLSTEDILLAIRNTNSLSVIMKESLEKMTDEYERRKLKNASK